MIILDAQVYEVISLAMRYFFTLIGVIIVWRSFSWLRKDRRLKHRRLKQLPDAGTIGILTVEHASGELQTGDVLPVPHEGVLGYLRTCDVVVPAQDVATEHLDFAFADGKGLFIYPRRGCEASVDGVPLVNRRASRQTPMQHGSVLQVGRTALRLGVFAGLNVQEARTVAWMPCDEAVPQEESPEAWAPEGAPAQPPAPPPYPPYPPYPPAPPYPPHPPVNPPGPWQGGDGHA